MTDDFDELESIAFSASSDPARPNSRTAKRRLAFIKKRAAQFERQNTTLQRQLKGAKRRMQQPITLAKSAKDFK